MRICFWGALSEALNGTPGGGAEYQLSLIIKNLYLKGLRSL